VSCQLRWCTSSAAQLYCVDTLFLRAKSVPCHLAMFAGFSACANCRGVFCEQHLSVRDKRRVAIQGIKEKYFMDLSDILEHANIPSPDDPSISKRTWESECFRLRYIARTKTKLLY
jgi:hypothetical protein